MTYNVNFYTDSSYRWILISTLSRIKDRSEECRGKMKEDIRNFIAGIVVGISNAIPGVSGGTMAVVLNVYDKILDAVSISRWKEHKRFLFVFCLGIASGIIGFSNIIIPLRENYPIALGFSFLGLIVGSIPLIYEHGVAGMKPKTYNVILAIITFLAMVAMSFIKKNEIANMSISDIQTFDVKIAILLLVSGIVGAIAMIIPGISGSLVMLLIGTYTMVIESIGEMNFYIIIPTGIGVLIGLLVGLKGIKKALELFPQAMYFIILGLVSGSIFSIYPGWNADAEGYISIGLFFVFATTAYISSKNEQ